MCNAAAEGVDGTEGVVTGHAVSEGFTTCAVLLVGVGKGYVRPLLHVMQRAVTRGDALDEGGAEGSVGEAERLASATVSSGGESILSRSAEEEECEGREIEDSLCTGLIPVLGEAGNEGPEYGDVDGPHPGGGGILVGPGLEEGLEAEDIVDAVQPGIRVAQSGELLAHGT
jgi:hypothetical protein